MTEDTLTQFKTEGQPAFPVMDKENDNSAASSTEETNTNPTGSSDQNKKEMPKENGSEQTNFADHPRWKERESDWKNRFNEQETRHTQELAKLREELDKRFNDFTPKSKEAPSKVPAWFGGDEDQWQEFQEWNKSLVSQAEENAIKRLTTQQEAEQKAIDEATGYFNEQVASIEEDKTINPHGVKVDRNKLLKFVLDNDLVDSKQRWNYRAAWIMMQANATSAKSEATQERKQIASATTANSDRAETKPSSFMTSEDFKNPTKRPW